MTANANFQMAIGRSRVSVGGQKRPVKKAFLVLLLEAVKTQEPFSSQFVEATYTTPMIESIDRQPTQFAVNRHLDDNELSLLDAISYKCGNEVVGDVLTNQLMDSVPDFEERHVRFNVDECDCILEDVCPLPNDRTLSQEEKEACWATVREQTKCRFEAAMLREKYMHSQPEYTEATQVLLEFCLLQADSEADLSYASLSDGIRKALSTIVCARARGLEFVISNDLEECKARSCEVVLDTQYQLSLQSAIQGNRRALLVSLQYQKVSLYASTWARIMAEGDRRITERQQKRLVRHESKRSMFSRQGSKRFSRGSSSRRLLRKSSSISMSAK